MKVIKETLPAKEVERYETSDGQVFDYKASAKHHEDELKRDAMLNSITKIVDNQDNIWYHLETEEQFEFFKEMTCVGRYYCNVHGDLHYPGWASFKIFYQDNSADIYEVYTLEEYKETINQLLETLEGLS